MEPVSAACTDARPSAGSAHTRGLTAGTGAVRAPSASGRRTAIRSAGALLFANDRAKFPQALAFTDPIIRFRQPAPTGAPARAARQETDVMEHASIEHPRIERPTHERPPATRTMPATRRASR